MSVRVSGTMTVTWSVLLPDDSAREVVACADPAVEAAMTFLPQFGAVHVWGEEREPAEVFIEVHEEDVEVEEDDREEGR